MTLFWIELIRKHSLYLNNVDFILSYFSDFYLDFDWQSILNLHYRRRPKQFNTRYTLTFAYNKLKIIIIFNGNAIERWKEKNAMRSFVRSLWLKQVKFQSQTCVYVYINRWLAVYYNTFGLISDFRL